MKTSNAKVVKTINLTPTWVSATRIYCAVLQNPKAGAEAKIAAEKDLLCLAAAMDAKQKTDDLVDSQIAYDEGADITDGATDDEK